MKRFEACCIFSQDVLKKTHTLLLAETELFILFSLFLGLFQPGYAYRVYAYKKKSVS